MTAAEAVDYGIVDEILSSESDVTKPKAKSKAKAKK
jgi:ATP-dependent protease ClpP protease subunit